jgi:putative ABC transport system permease protein
MLAVELDDPTKIDEVTAQLSHSTTDIVFDVVPGTVQNLFELRWLLLWAAMVLVLVGTLLAINASVAGDRRWRRDAAVLRAFGATPRDLLGIAGWLGIMRGALVGVVGTVAGVAIGVRAWSAIADSLGLPAPWRVPSLTVLAVLLPVAVFLLLAALTATRARTSRLTTSLRAE